MFRYVYDVARNHARILNHIDLIQKKIIIGEQLSFIQRQNRPFDNRLQNSIEFKNHIKNLLSHNYHRLLEQFVPIGLLEFHPTDNCDLNCIKCYYSRSPITFPLQILPKILRLLRPKGIVLVGGGEPTLYYDKESKSDFNGLVFIIKKILPSVKLGLITNGTSIPQGDWIKYINWVRVSVDAVNAMTYEKLKGKDAFDHVINNLMVYLESSIRHVGAGFLCNRINIDEASRFILLMYKLTKSLPESIKSKLNIQFRPFRKKPKLADNKDIHSQIQDLSCSDTQIHRIALDLEELRKDQSLASFMDITSNWEKIIDFALRDRQFDHCYRALSFNLLRPNGDLYPCFVHINNPNYIMANLLKDDIEREILIGELMGFYYFNCYENLCSPELCPLYRENRICTKYFNGHRISVPDDAINDPFF